MKRILLILAVFTLAITALHAQAPVPVLTPDPALQQVVDAVLPVQYTAHSVAIVLGLMILFRMLQARRNGLSWLDAFVAAFTGTNTPTKAPLIIGALCLLTVTSCTTMQKLGAALSTPRAKQIEIGLAQIGLFGAVVGGVVSPGDALTIAKGVAIVTSADDGSSKVVGLTKLGLDAAVEKGIVKPGDVVTIKDVTATITPAAPAPPVAIELTSGK